MVKQIPPFFALLIIIFALFSFLMLCIGILKLTPLSEGNAIFWALLITALCLTSMIILPDPIPKRTQVYTIIGATIVAFMFFMFVTQNAFENNHLAIMFVSIGFGVAVGVLLVFSAQIYCAICEFARDGKITTEKDIEAKQRAEQEAAEEKAQQEFYESFDDVEDESDNKSYDYNRESFHESASKKSTNQEYGHDKHHPDDAKFWSIINDPAANENEQMAALKAVKKRQEKREAQTASNLKT